MRGKFAGVVRKPVFTFAFDRGSRVTRDLFMKLVKARDSKVVICATPSSVKSFMLKFIEMMRLSTIAKRFREQSTIVELKVNPEDV